MVLPGTGSHAPVAQSCIRGWEISSAVSCDSGSDTMSVTFSGRCVFASSLTLRAMLRKMSQSVFDSHTGGMAALSGWMKECMSVVLMSSFSYQDADGSTMSEYSADVSMRKFRSITRSIFPLGATSRHTTSLTSPLATSSAIWLWCVPR
ncbi:hypothetical protein GALL_444670 [mine drainage metagenome]|uniref:Uncharacterized protein n=1 Tax=mine drainage metagenome TaxID=410659 RepID=A0A1J5Q1Y0_9ZZZZ